MRTVLVACGITGAALLGGALCNDRPAWRAPAPVNLAATPASTSRPGLEAAIAMGRTHVAASPGDSDAAVRLADALLRAARVRSDATFAIEAERVLDAALREDPAAYFARRMLGVA